MRPPRPCGTPAVARQPAAPAMPPPHTTQRVSISCRRPSVTCPGATSVDLGVEVQLHPLRASTLRGIVVRALARTAPSSVWPRSTRCTRAASTARSRYSTRHRPRDHVGQRAGRLDAGRAAADDDEVERPAVDQRGVAVGGLEHAEDPRAQPLGVVERVQREGVLARRRASRRSSAREPAASTTASPSSVSPSVGGDRARSPGRSTPPRPSSRRRCGGCGTACAARTRCSLGGELGRRDLVQQRLELVVVVAVEQRDAARRRAARASARSRARRSRRRR